MSEFSALVQAYYQNPVNNRAMPDATISRHEGNSLCGDDLTVYLKIEEMRKRENEEKINSQFTDHNSQLSKDELLSEDNLEFKIQNLKLAKVVDRSYDGMPSMITQAAASFFSELVIGKTLDEVLHMNEQTMQDNDFIVSERRRRASVIAILATRNAIHAYLKDGKEDKFEDLLID